MHNIFVFTHIAIIAVLAWKPNNADANSVYIMANETLPLVGNETVTKEYENASPSACILECTTQKHWCSMVQVKENSCLFYMVDFVVFLNWTTTERYLSYVRQEMWENKLLVSKQKPAYAESEYNNVTYAERAVDGVINGQIYHSKGSYEAFKWWYVDLLRTYRIHVITVYNKDTGCCPGRFNNITVSVSTDEAILEAFNWLSFTTCGFYAGPATAADNPFNFYCHDKGGRFAAVAKTTEPGKDSVLQFKEVLVYASFLADIF